MRWGVRTFVSICVAFATVVVGIDSSNGIRDNQNFWHPSAQTVFISIGILTLSVIYGLFDALLERKRAKRRDEISVVVSERLFPLWYRISSSIDGDDAKEKLGVHAWFVPSWYSRISKPMIRDRIPERIRKHLWTPALWRAAQFRLEHSDQQTGIQWRRGKGAIGLCWKHTDVWHKRLDDLWGEAELNYGDWVRLEPSKRIGLNFHEYKKIRRKYGYVIAMPIYRPRGRGAPQFLGCIAVDLPRSCRHINLDNEDQRSHIVTAATQIEREIDKML